MFCRFFALCARWARRQLAPMAFAVAGLMAGVMYLTPNPGDTHASASNPPTTLKPYIFHTKPKVALEQPATPFLPPAPDTKPLETSPSPPDWDLEVTVGPGDSLSAIFQRLGLLASVPSLLQSGVPTRPLHRLHPGQTLHILTDDQGLLHLMLQPTPTREAHYLRTPDGAFLVNYIDLPMEYRRRTVRKTIERTLFDAGYDAGLSPAMILALAHVFSWDIDFALDIHRGDQFKLVWDEHWIQGRRVKDGPIIAAEFTNRGRTYRAVRYAKPGGNAIYYTPDGQPLRKPFLRTPVDFTRISSRFNPRRLHPILKQVRPHRGVDYAAPTGTPIYATGDGTVIQRGLNGGYGRSVLIRHGTRYATVYAHLSRYARGLKAGSKVVQGQMIGRVGKSGMATGPHLHYEFRVDGIHRDPLKITLPSSQPLQYSQLSHFRQQTWPALIALGASPNIRVAYADAP